MESDRLRQVEERVNDLHGRFNDIADRVYDLEAMLEKAETKTGETYIDAGEMSPEDVKKMVGEMDVEALKEFAKLNGIDIGQSTSQSGIQKKILDHLEKALSKEA